MHVYKNWKAQNRRGKKAAISVRIILSLTVKLRVCTLERLNIPSCKIPFYLFPFVHLTGAAKIYIQVQQFLHHTWLEMHVHVWLCFACVSKSLQPHSPDLPMTTVSHFFFLVHRFKHTKTPCIKMIFVWHATQINLCYDTQNQCIIFWFLSWDHK